jgi:hypothetical protein
MSNEQKYRESKIVEILFSMSSDFSELSFMWEFLPDDAKEEDSYISKESELVSDFEYKAKAVYRLIVVYLEVLNLKEYLADFKAEFPVLLIENRKKLFEGEYDDNSGENYSKIVGKLWHFLSPFEFSHQGYIGSLLKQTGLTYLERILRNTQLIIDEKNTMPKSEPQVYNSVKSVLKYLFPSSLHPKSSFLTPFKGYVPDILIPEIHTAVEYKYADTEKKLKSQIDEITVDTKSYTGDEKYKIFYAVFYVTDDFWGIDKFEAVWKGKDFPKNWKFIYIIGKKYSD